ncbi:MAG: hypothetical protein ACOX45_00055 [Acutalibacteraceae bacterium]
MAYKKTKLIGRFDIIEVLLSDNGSHEITHIEGCVLMEYYDLHCDTIGECFNTGKALFSNDMHISLEKAEIFDAYVQVFAIWIPDVMRVRGGA